MGQSKNVAQGKKRDYGCKMVMVSYDKSVTLPFMIYEMGFRRE